MKNLLIHNTMNRLLRFSLLTVLLFINTTVWAGTSSVFTLTVDKPISRVYANMKTSIEKSRFYLFYEMNIGKNLAHFSKNWGADYNRNNLKSIRSIIFCIPSLCERSETRNR